MIQGNRVAASLRAAAETGAYGTVWAVIEAALPGLLRDTPLREAAAPMRSLLFPIIPNGCGMTHI